MRRDQANVLTIPNAVTVVRLSLLPLFLWLLLGRHERYVAGWTLAVMGMTDWIDGYLARRLNQVSTVGKILDPVADRLLLLGGVTAILIDGSVPVWVAVVALAREAVVATTVVVLAVLGASRIDVSWWGKAGTLGLMFAFPLFLCGHSNANWHRAGEDLAWLFALPGLACALISAAGYLGPARAALSDGRAARRRAASRVAP